MNSAVLRPIRAFTALVLLLTASAIGAHSPSEQAVAFHGGIAYTTETFNLELLAADGRLRLYVRDRHNRPLDVGGSNAKALAWGKENTAEIELKPSEHNALEGAFQVASLQRVIVTLHMPDHDPVKAWFSGIRN
jgi:hypothetical protein